MPTTQSEIFYSIALTLLKNVGSITARKLIAHLGSAEAVFSASGKIFHQITGVGPHLIQELKNKSYLIESENILKSCEKNKVTIFVFQDELYPYRLKHIYDLPYLVFEFVSIGYFDVTSR